MNRYAERLKQERRIERLNQKEGEAYEAAVSEGVERAVKVLRTAAMYALMVKFGFGEIRLARFLVEFEKVAQAMADHTVSHDAICEEIERVAGLEYDKRDLAWVFPHVKSWEDI